MATSGPSRGWAQRGAAFCGRIREAPRAAARAKRIKKDGTRKFIGNKRNSGNGDSVGDTSPRATEGEATESVTQKREKKSEQRAIIEQAVWAEEGGGEQGGPA